MSATYYLAKIQPDAAVEITSKLADSETIQAAIERIILTGARSTTPGCVWFHSEDEKDCGLWVRIDLKNGELELGEPAA